MGPQGVQGPGGPAGSQGAAGATPAPAWQSFRDILFDYDRSVIRATETSKITEIETYLRQNPNVNLRLDGHADPRGSNKYNLALSERRVKAVRDALAKAGVSASRMSTGAHGEAQPKCTESTEACWQLDRRVEVLVTGQ